MRDRFPGSLLDGNGRHLADQRQRGSNGEQETLTGTEIATRETSWGEPRLIVMPGSAAAAEAVTAATRTTTDRQRSFFTRVTSFLEVSLWIPLTRL